MIGIIYEDDFEDEMEEEGLALMQNKTLWRNFAISFLVTAIALGLMLFWALASEPPRPTIKTEMIGQGEFLLETDHLDRSIAVMIDNKEGQ